MNNNLQSIGPNTTNPYPMVGQKRVCFIRNIINNPNIIIGDYTYYDDPNGVENFEKNVLYHYPFLGDKLIIGKFCAIAEGVKFIMNGANHKLSAFTTYPFSLFGNGWEKVIPKKGELPFKGDTIIDNDVWIGFESVIMPGIHIGNGAIVGARSLVTRDVPPYAIVGGNPARIIKMRFTEEVVSLLQKAEWWNWDSKKITESLEILTSNNLEKLKEII